MSLEQRRYSISFLPLSWWQIGLIVALVVILTIATKGRILSWIV